MISNYSEETGRLYILSNNSYIYLEDFRTIFNVTIEPALATKYFNELRYLCNVVIKLPICLVIVIFMRLFTSFVLTSMRDFLKEGHAERIFGSDMAELFGPGAPPDRLIQYLEINKKLLMIEESRYKVDGLSKQLENMIGMLVENTELHQD